MCDHCTPENNENTTRCVKSPWDSCNYCGCDHYGVLKKHLCTNMSCPESKK